MLETSLFVITIATLAMISPGPDFFLILRNASRYRGKVAMMSSLGVILGVTTHMVYCVAGLAVVITTTPLIFNFLKYAGAAYLIYIGIQSLFSKGGNKLEINPSPQQDISYRHALLQGYLCNILNPKATLFFLSLFTQILNIDSSLGEKIWYATIIILLAVVWWPLFVVMVQNPWVRQRLSKTHKLVDRLLGGVLVALGVKVAIG